MAKVLDVGFRVWKVGRLLLFRSVRGEGQDDSPNSSQSKHAACVKEEDGICQCSLDKIAGFEETTAWTLVFAPSFSRTATRKVLAATFRSRTCSGFPMAV